jgi:hypothetical protein
MQTKRKGNPLLQSLGGDLDIAADPMIGKPGTKKLVEATKPTESKEDVYSSGSDAENDIGLVHWCGDKEFREGGVRSQEVQARMEVEEGRPCSQEMSSDGQNLAPQCQLEEPMTKRSKLRHRFPDKDEGPVSKKSVVDILEYAPSATPKAIEAAQEGSTIKTGLNSKGKREPVAKKGAGRGGVRGMPEVGNTKGLNVKQPRLRRPPRRLTVEQ